MTARPTAKVVFEYPLRIVAWSEAADGGRGGFTIEWDARPDVGEYTTEPWRQVLQDELYKDVLAAYIKKCPHQQVSAATEHAAVVSFVDSIVRTLEQRDYDADRMWWMRHNEYVVEQILDKRTVNHVDYDLVQTAKDSAARAHREWREAGGNGDGRHKRG
jgi:hypothetical protein